MATEEPIKLKPPPSTPPPAAVEVEEKPIVPVEPRVDDSKALAIVEKPIEALEKKPSEGSVDRDAVLAKVSSEKKGALICAWEENEKTKAENKAQQKLAVVAAWENSKKADIEAELRNIEENLEKKKAKYVENMKNKIALIHKTAEEKRANTEAKRGEELLKSEEMAAKCIATGSVPKKGWFSS